VSNKVRRLRREEDQRFLRKNLRTFRYLCAFACDHVCLHPQEVPTQCQRSCLTVCPESMLWSQFSPIFCAKFGVLITIFGNFLC
jgi:hypothetical protein